MSFFGCVSVHICGPRLFTSFFPMATSRSSWYDGEGIRKDNKLNPSKIQECENHRKIFELSVDKVFLKNAVRQKWTY